jgi:hypothetical protein
MTFGCGFSLKQLCSKISFCTTLGIGFDASHATKARPGMFLDYPFTTAAKN